MTRAPSSGVRYFWSTASCTCFTSFPATCHFGSMLLPNSVGFIAAYWWTSDVVMVSVICGTPFLTCVAGPGVPDRWRFDTGQARKDPERAALSDRSNVYSRTRRPCRFLWGGEL